MEEQQAQFDEHWTVADQQEKLMEITEQMKVLEGLYEQLLNAYVPGFKYELYMMAVVSCSAVCSIVIQNISTKGKCKYVF